MSFAFSQAVYISVFIVLLQLCWKRFLMKLSSPLYLFSVQFFLSVYACVYINGKINKLPVVRSLCRYLYVLGSQDQPSSILNRISSSQTQLLFSLCKGLPTSCIVCLLSRFSYLVRSYCWDTSFFSVREDCAGPYMEVCTRFIKLIRTYFATRQIFKWMKQ